MWHVFKNGVPDVMCTLGIGSSAKVAWNEAKYHIPPEFRITHEGIYARMGLSDCWS
jgi:hypothetical protein